MQVWVPVKVPMTLAVRTEDNALPIRTPDRRTVIATVVGQFLHIKENDVLTNLDGFSGITELNGEKIHRPVDFYRAVRKHAAGDEVTISYLKPEDKKLYKATFKLSFIETIFGK